MHCHAENELYQTFLTKKGFFQEFFCLDAEVGHIIFLNLLSDQALTIQNQLPPFGPKTHRAIIEYLVGLCQ